MANVIFNEISNSFVEGHENKMMKKITFNYKIEKNGIIISSMQSSMKIDGQGNYFLNSVELKEQLANTEYYPLVIARLKENFVNQYR